MTMFNQFGVHVISGHCLMLRYVAGVERKSSRLLIGPLGQSVSQAMTTKVEQIEG